MLACCRGSFGDLTGSDGARRVGLDASEIRPSATADVMSEILLTLLCLPKVPS